MNAKEMWEKDPEYRKQTLRGLEKSWGVRFDPATFGQIVKDNFRPIEMKALNSGCKIERDTI